MEKKWDVKCINQYNRIIKETNAKCVVSSSWRVMKQHIFELQELFILQGIKVDIVGFTPILSKERGLEIQTYLNDNNSIDKYCILDDKIEDILGFDLVNIIQPISYIGLTEELADKAIKLLN